MGLLNYKFIIGLIIQNIFLELGWGLQVQFSTDTQNQILKIVIFWDLNFSTKRENVLSNLDWPNN